jgi:hypothetical protein
MQRKRSFEPDDPVSTFTGQEGLVISKELYSKAQDRLKEGRRPGHYFAPGCCHNPDYVTQVPVLFGDGTFDVMRAMNIKKIASLNRENKENIYRVIEDKLD